MSVADWQSQAQPLGVGGGVLVQAAPTEAETRFLLDQADTHPAVLGVVGWTDLLANDASQRIAGLARHPKLKGLRPMLQDIADADWILQPSLAPALQTMAEHGLVFDALAKPAHLPRILALAQDHPALAIVIDHGTKPDIANGAWQPWADDLARIAAETSAVCKLSGLLTEAGAAPAPDAARCWARHVLDSFGPQRVSGAATGRCSSWRAATRRGGTRCTRCSCTAAAAERAAVLGGTARRVYGL